MADGRKTTPLDDARRQLLPGDLRFILDRLRRRGLEAWLVGPAVRDLMGGGNLNKAPRLDLLVLGSDPRAAESALGGVATDQLVIGPPERFRRGLAFEVRGPEGEKLRKLHLRVVDKDRDLRQELAAREVSLNAMALGPDLEIYDPFGGAEDLEAGRLRPVQPMNKVFRERPLFILKIAKHAAFHGVEPDEPLIQAAAAEADRLLDIMPFRWRPEFERMLLNRFPDLGLRFLHRCGALGYVMPELELLSGFEKSCRVHHKDVFEHTLAVTRQARSSPVIRWAALLHDVGKLWTRSVSRDGQVHFFRHEEMSAYLARGILARFDMEPQRVERIIFLVLNHSRITLYSDDWTDSAVRRLIRDMGAHLEDLVSLARADITSKREDRVEEIRRLTSELEERIREIREADSYVPPLPKGIGSRIMHDFGLEAGPVIGEMKRILERDIEEGRLERGLTEEEYVRHLALRLQTDPELRGE